MLVCGKIVFLNIKQVKLEKPTKRKEMINTKFILYLEAGGWAQVYVLLGSGSE